ncbi:Hsp20/alpha crystallin family protein [Anaerolineales bacterium]
MNKQDQNQVEENQFDARKEFNNLKNAVGKTLEQGFQTLQNATAPLHNVKLDIYEEGDYVYIKTSSFDGLDAGSLDISVENSVLTISGETKADEEVAARSYFTQERRFGKFTRSVDLPVSVLAQEAQAKVLKSGGLLISLPIDKSHFQNIKINTTE